MEPFLSQLFLSEASNLLHMARKHCQIEASELKISLSMQGAISD